MTVSTPRWKAGLLAFAAVLQISFVEARIFDQSDAVTQSNEAGDQFGRTLASGDFNGDGFADLAVGSPFENTDGATDTGIIAVFYGSANGLSTNSESITQNSIVTATNEDGDQMAWSLAAGNFDGDEYDDLAVGIPYEDTDGATDTGMVAIMFGSAAGLLPSNSEAFTQNSVVTATNEDGDLMGWALAVGNFDGDDYDDLAVGIPAEDTDGASDTGMVAIMFGSADGLLPSNTEAFTQNSVVTATNEEGDQFGYTLAAGNFDGDEYDDLAVGVPFENTDGATDTGMVAILFGSASGLLPSNSEAFTQNSISGAANEDGDNLGRALATGNFNGDAYDDLAVGVGFEDIGSNTDSGAAFILFGSAAGLLPSNTEVLTQEEAYDENEAGDRAGYAVTTGDFDGDGFDDLVMGVPREDIENSGLNTGAIQAFFGSAAGLLPQRSYWAGQVSFGGAEENSDEFGFTLAAGDFDNDGRDGLAVGTPLENIGDIINAGAVFVQEIDPALPIITARAAIVMNRATGEVLGSKMPDRRLAMASTTKIMTALLAAEAVAGNMVELDDSVTISSNAATVSGSGPADGSCVDNPNNLSTGSCMPGATRSLVAGDTISLEDLLYGTMLPSGNNAAIAVGEHVSGTEGAFVTLMNARAGALGMSRTVYVSPHGRDPEKTLGFCPNIGFTQSINLDDPGCAHYSTARDLAELADFALNKPLFRTVVSTPRWTTSTWRSSRGASQDAAQTNTNLLIRNVTGASSSSRYRGAYGVKTGTTGNAGECLVSAAERCGVDLVAVVLGADDATNSRYPDSRAILDFAFSRAIEVPDVLALPFTESFESDGVGCRFFVPGIADAPVDIDSGDYLGVIKALDINYLGAAGSRVFAAQDIDDNGQGDGFGSSTFVPFDVRGAASVKVAMRVGAGNGNFFETTDSVLLEYRFGLGAWSRLAAFENDGSTKSPLFEDADFDGRGEGTQLGTTLQNFHWSKGTGGNKEMEFRVRFNNLNGTGESAAVDSLRVVAVGALGYRLEDWQLIHNLVRVPLDKDTDRNGLVDLMEFLFNLDPRDPNDRGNLPRIERKGKELSLRFTRMRTQDGQLRLQMNPDLTPNRWKDAVLERDYEVITIRPSSRDPAEEELVLRLLPPPGQEEGFYRFVGEIGRGGLP